MPDLTHDYSGPNPSLVSCTQRGKDKRYGENRIEIGGMSDFLRKALDRTTALSYSADLDCTR